MVACLAATVPRPKRRGLLDVGGGTGRLAVQARRRRSGARVTVLDPTPQLLATRSLERRHAQGARQRRGDAVRFGAPSTLSSSPTRSTTSATRTAAVREFARVVPSVGRVLMLDLDPRGFVMRRSSGRRELLGEPGAFLTPTRCASSWRSHGIDGESVYTKTPSYRFLGRVREKPPDADGLRVAISVPQR